MSNSYLKNIFKQTVYKNYLNQKGNFTYYGEKVFFPKNSTTFMLAMKDGIYEHEILKFIQSNIKDHSTYIDVGANIGLMSIPVLSQNKSVKVLSLEASPNTFNYLKKTHENCSFKERWSIYNKAVSNSNKEIDLFITSNSDGAFESIMDTRRVSFSGTVKVPGITIDELWASLNKPAVSFIKSDIEGADLLALQGAISCMAQCKPMIMIEWNRVNIKPFEFQNQHLLDFCNNNNYRCYAIPSLIPINNSMELSLHTVITENYLLTPII